MIYKIKNIIIAVLFLLSLMFLIFCPIWSMKIELNDNVTKAVCNVSVFTAYLCPTILVDDFIFTLQSDMQAIGIIAIVQCIGLVLTIMRKSYAAGIVMVTVSWILLLNLSLVIINVQSELLIKYGSTQQQNISVFMLFILSTEIVLTIFNGVNHFRPIKKN